MSYTGIRHLMDGIPEIKVDRPRQGSIYDPRDFGNRYRGEQRYGPPIIIQPTGPPPVSVQVHPPRISLPEQIARKRRREEKLFMPVKTDKKMMRPVVTEKVARSEKRKRMISKLRKRRQSEDQQNMQIINNAFHTAYQDHQEGRADIDEVILGTNFYENGENLDPEDTNQSGLLMSSGWGDFATGDGVEEANHIHQIRAEELAQLKNEQINIQPGTNSVDAGILGIHNKQVNIDTLDFIQDI